MAERTTLTQGVQIGVEVTNGVAVSSNRKLLATSIDLGIKADLKTFRPSGGKFSTITTLGKEWAEAKISGPLTYNDIVYLLSGNVAYAAPVQQGATDAYLWTHTPEQSAEDTIKTFTVEQGSSVRAHKAAYGLVNSFGYTANRSEVMTKGSMLMQEISDGITMTATPTEIDIVPVLPSQVCIYADDDSGDLGTTKLTRAFAIDWEFSGRYGAVWPLDCALDGFAAHVETEPKGTFKLLVEANAQGMGFLSNMRVGSKKFFSVQMTGDEIDTGENYSIIHDICGTVTGVTEFKDQEGVYAIEWTFEATYDATWGKAFEFKVKNALTGL